jgi:hypothetical protein
MVKIELIYMLDGVKWRGNCDAEGEMIETSTLDGKTITAKGKLRRERDQFVVEGSVE